MTESCKYCQNEYPNLNEPFAIDYDVDYVSIIRSGETSIIESDLWEADINYCPMCGRKLGDGNE